MKPLVKCSFCGKNEEQVNLIVKAKTEGLAICDECIVLCVYTLIKNDFNPYELIDMPVIEIKEEGFVVRVKDKSRKFCFGNVAGENQWDALCKFLTTDRVEDLKKKIEEKENELATLRADLEKLHGEKTDAE